MSNKISANDIRVGNVLEFDKKLWTVLKRMHTQPGKGGAFVQVEMKSIDEDGTKRNERFRSSETVVKAHLDEESYQYLYHDPESVALMHNTSFEQISLDAEMIGEQIGFLQDGMNVKVLMHNNRPITISLPEKITVEILETEAVVKGQTATSSYKPAMVTGNVRIMVPPFVGEGDEIIIRTEDNSYVERAK